jgi:hypothetical protein
MSDFDDETATGSCHNISTAEYDTKMEGVREDGLSVSVTDWTVIRYPQKLPLLVTNLHEVFKNIDIVSNNVWKSSLCASVNC